MTEGENIRIKHLKKFIVYLGIMLAFFIVCSSFNTFAFVPACILLLLIIVCILLLIYNGQGVLPYVSLVMFLCVLMLSIILPDAIKVLLAG